MTTFVKPCFAQQNSSLETKAGRTHRGHEMNAISANISRNGDKKYQRWGKKKGSEWFSKTDV